MLNSASAELGTFFCRMTHLQSEFLTPRMMSEVPKSAETLICTVRTRWIFSGKKNDPGSDANHTYSILPQIFGTRLYGSIDPIYSTKISRRGITCSSRRRDELF